ncbi:MAG: ferritin-like fold-containing protein [Actinomycetes bacterium]
MPDDAYDAAVIDLLGVLAYGELSAFERLCADAALAPSLDDKAEVAAMACAEFGHFQQLRTKLIDLGVSAEDAMRPFVAPLDAFHASTAPADWLEGLVKAYVGDGIAADFYREISILLDDENQALVLAVFADTGHSAFVVSRVRSAIDVDPRVAGRLALWGRRLMGEALSQAQRVAAERDALAGLLAGGSGGGMDLVELGRMFTRITEQHTKRMAALGLAA